MGTWGNLAKINCSNLDVTLVPCQVKGSLLPQAQRANRMEMHTAAMHSYSIYSQLYFYFTWPNSVWLYKVQYLLYYSRLNILSSFFSSTPNDIHLQSSTAIFFFFFASTLQVSNINSPVTFLYLIFRLSHKFHTLASISRIQPCMHILKSSGDITLPCLTPTPKLTDLPFHSHRSTSILIKRWSLPVATFPCHNILRTSHKPFLSTLP